MKNYYLFLDESNSMGRLQYFCLAGCIIEENIYTTKIIPAINELKNDIFNSTEVPLHESEIRDAEETPYDIFKNFEKKKRFWEKLRNIFSNYDFTTIGTAINSNKYRKIYNDTYSNNEYYVALQIVLENFVHFLEHNDGKGIVYIESRNPTADKKLASHYHTIVANGTLFLNKYSFQKRLTTINFSIKQENTVGLQIADFIPNPLNREYSGSKQKPGSIYDLINSKLYDGTCNMKEKFGFKIIT